MKKYIVREVEPECTDFSLYFEDEYITGVTNWNANLFIIGLDRYIADFNGEEFNRVKEQAENIINEFSYIGGRYATYDSYKDCMEDFGIKYTPKKCHDLKEWAKDADERETEDIARFLSITTGEEWEVLSVYGYNQGDYAEVVFCPKYHSKDAAKSYGEVWVGCATEFCVVSLDEDGEEEDACYGFIVADHEAYDDEDYKRLVCGWYGIDPDDASLETINGCNTYMEYTYRIA